MAILCRNFYTGNTVDIARSLIGCYLVRRYEGELLDAGQAAPAGGGL